MYMYVARDNIYEKKKNRDVPVGKRYDYELTG